MEFMRRDHRGFAVPLVIFLIAVLTVILATGVVRVRADRRTAELSSSTWTALTVAQSGLQNYLATRTAAPGEADSVRLYVPGGYADVIATTMQKPADATAPRKYILRSTGYVIWPYFGKEPQAQRTIAQFAQWQTATMDVRAGFTAANGLTPGTGGTIQLYGGTGADACFQPTSVLSLHVAGPSPVDPATEAPQGVDENDAPADVANGTDIDWPGTVGGAMVPDYTYIRLSDNSYPIQLVTGDAVFGAAGATSTGTGLLIVTGDLETQGTSVDWDGVVLVGGRIAFNAATSRFRGAVVSGLKAQFPDSTPPAGVIGEATTVNITYNACRIADALGSLTGLVPVANAWVDNWATY